MDVEREEVFILVGDISGKVLQGRWHEFHESRCLVSGAPGTWEEEERSCLFNAALPGKPQRKIIPEDQDQQTQPDCIWKLLFLWCFNKLTGRDRISSKAAGSPTPHEVWS